MTFTDNIDFYFPPAAHAQFYLTANPTGGFNQQGKFSTLDNSGQWFRDPTTNTLYLWTPTGDNPNNTNHTVEAKARSSHVRHCEQLLRLPRH